MSKEKTSTMTIDRNTSSAPRRRSLFGAILVGFALLFSASAAAASAAPDVRSTTIISPSNWVTGDDGRVLVELDNGGDTATSEFAPPFLTVTVDLPPNVTSTGPSPTWFSGFFWECNGTSTVTCTTPFPLQAFSGNVGIFAISAATIMLSVEVASGPGVTGTFPLTTTVSSGGMSGSNVETQQVTIADTPPSFGAHGITAGAFDQAGNDFSQAGGHPDEVRSDFAVNIDEMATFEAGPVPTGAPLKGLVVNAPPGFVGDPTATPQCTQAQMTEGTVAATEGRGCPPSTQVGTVLIRTTIVGNFQVGVYNLVPPGGQLAQFGFWTPVGIQRLNPSIRADGNYGFTVGVPRISQADVLLRSTLKLWGNPSDPVHDKERCAGLNIPTSSCNGFSSQGVPFSDIKPHPYDGPEKAFLTLPTNCVQDQVTNFHLDKWTDPAPEDGPLTDPRWTHQSAEAPRSTGCEAIPFDPTISLDPTTRQADSPTGLNVDLHIPRQHDSDPDGLVQAHLKKATTTLPEGLGFNAAIANGLEACSPEQIGLQSTPGATPIRFNNGEPSCPDGSKIGSGRVDTPLLEEPLRGEVFLAAQDENPFDSNFAIYLVVREPSVLVKLAGKVEPDLQTGQIKVTFDQNPQLPFEDIQLQFYDGPRAALATPTTCGTFSSVTEMVPWSAKDPNNPTAAEIVTAADPFSIDLSPTGTCASDKAQLPLNLGLSAGSKDPIAGAHSPFSIRLTRPDGNQVLDRVEISPPPGFVGSLKGIPYCSEAQIAAAMARDSGKAEKQSPSCPVASQLGTTLVGAGAGPMPYYDGGKVYLAGPYKGETLSAVVITPAVAGPFDLGNVVVRAALKLDPRTARITAVTDPLPKTIEGVPLRIRDIRVDLDRPNWATNPTNCEAMSVDVTAYGTSGGVSKLSNRYQVSGCEKLGFKPKLSIHLKGGTKRGDHPALAAKLTTRSGDANIARAAVTLPPSAFLDQAHIRTVCTRVQFAANTCPKGSIYGFGRATTPLLDDPIQGNVYLRSSDNKLPDLVAALRGVANIEAVGRIDSVKGGIRNTFDVIPDAPVEAFTLQMQGGKKGLVVNSQNLCANVHRATVKLTAQNGKHYDYHPKVIADGCKKAHKEAKRGGSGRD